MAIEARAEARLASLASRPAAWARQGAGRLSAAFNIVSELTAEEFSLGIGMIRERLNFLSPVSLVEIGGRALTGFIDAEKILLHLAAEETELAVEALKEGFRLRPAAAAIADLAPKGVTAYVNMGKSFLEDADRQNQELVESFAEGKPLMIGDRLKTFARQRVECFVENQKQFLDQIDEQVTIATEGGTEVPKTSSRTRSQVLSHAAREGVDKFVDAEKKIVHLAIAHIESPRPHGKTRPRTSFAELTQKSVHNVTAAEKSMLDLAIKPMDKPAGKARATRKAPRRAAKRKKAV